MTGTRQEPRRGRSAFRPAAVDGIERTVGTLRLLASRGKWSAADVARSLNIPLRASYRFLDLVSKGLTATEVAQATGVTPSAVYNWCSKHGIKFRRSPRGRSLKRGAS